MKPVMYTLMVLLGLCYCITPIEGILEEAILEALEEFRNRMCHPIPKFGLPALDPFQIANLEYEMNNKVLIDFKGSVKDFRLTGLSDFTINHLKISTVPLRRSTIDVTLPLTSFKSMYTAKGSLAYILNLAGDGNAEASVDKLRVGVSWIFKTGLSLGIRGLKITINIGAIQMDFQNLIEEERVSEFVHALVNELGVELLDDLWQDENKYVEELLELKINNFLRQYTINDIINIIGNGGGGPIFGPEDPPPDCKGSVTQ